MDTLLYWGIPLIIVGLVVLRKNLYRDDWGHGWLIRKLPGCAVGLALLAPLYYMEVMVQGGLAVVGLLWLLPYGAIVRAVMQAKARRGLRQLAGEWKVACLADPTTGLPEVVRPLPAASGGELRASLVRVVQRSIHPGVRKRKAFYMLAFVIPLDKPPPFLCSLMRGWFEPQYFEKHWREKTLLTGDIVSMSSAELQEGRETGGRREELREYNGLDERLLGGFHAICGTGQQDFERAFSGEIVDGLLASCAVMMQYELDVTPTSIAIYTACCSRERQVAHVDFLERLSRALRTNKTV